MVWAPKPRTHKIWYIARLTVRDLRLTSRENDNAKLRNSQTGETYREEGRRWPSERLRAKRLSGRGLQARRWLTTAFVCRFQNRDIFFLRI
jgi:hypothetical protein